jgi:endonuclease/exonuclease/phosphatase family metal-dependent hydrolase
MPGKFRVASFNVENLFGRAKVINFDDPSVGDGILQKIDNFRLLLKKTTYTAQDKKDILKLYNSELKPYIEVREDRGKLFKHSGWAVTGVAAKGAGDWDGEIAFKRADFSDMARKNTAQVIKDVRADVACIVEAESRPTLQAFDTHLLGSRYKFEMLIDANDPRGIDVGLYSKHLLGGIRTHMFDKQGTKLIFSRDCLEVEVLLPNGKTLNVLCNHFKSRGYDFDGTSDQKRQRQATRVAEILGQYDLTKDWVMVAGDFNDNPASAALQPLLSVQNLHDVLELQFPGDAMQRWTYHFNQFEQIDFILVSKALKGKFRKAGVERRGMFELEKLTTASGGLVEIEKEYDSVTRSSDAASDHGAVWAEFDL